MAALLMVFTFFMFLVTDIIVRRVAARRAIVTAGVATDTGAKIPFGISVEDLVVPAGLFYHQGHTWAGLDTSGKIRVGLDDFAQKILGKIDSIKLHKVGDTVSKGEKIFTIEQNGRKAEFNSPVDGVITSINDDVVNNPVVVKENPYEKGWIYSIKPANLANNIKSLSIAEDARNWIKNEVQRFEAFIAEHFMQDKVLGTTLADGGTVVEGVMEYMDDFSWYRMQEEFLSK